MSTTFGPESAYVLALDVVLLRLEAVERRIREAEAEKLQLLAEALSIAACESQGRLSPTPSDAAGELAYRSVRAEVATALHQSEAAVERQMSHAFTLTREYPEAFAAYREGRISQRHAAVITDAGAIIGSADSPEVLARRAGYEAAVLECAIRENPARLRPVAKRLAEQFAEVPLEERHAEARKRRRVYLLDGDDGMSDLIAHLPATEAHGIYRRLTSMSRKLEQHEAVLRREAEAVPGNEDVRGLPQRGRDELRADLLADLLLSGSPDSTAADRPVGLGSIRARVQVSVTEGALLGNTSDDAPISATLEGFGPIANGTARVLAGAASHWQAVRHDPATGCVLSVDRYRPSEAMRRRLGARDQHCRFPGCRVPLARCDVDHTIDAQHGGPTSTDNLAHLCRGHHTLKHNTGWRVAQDAEGNLDWLSPTGRHHRDRPRSRVSFAVSPSGGSPPGTSPPDPPRTSALHCAT